MTTTARRKNLSKAALAGFGLVGLLSACTAEGAGTTQPTTAAPTATDAATTSAGQSSGAASSASGSSDSGSSGGTYQDGSYSASGSYTSPGGQQAVKVDLVLANDIVTSVTVTPEGVDPNSIQYETQFAENVSSEVVGKDIDELNVGKVAGSSLTATGFNAAIESIKSEAKA